MVPIHLPLAPTGMVLLDHRQQRFRCWLGDYRMRRVSSGRTTVSGDMTTFVPSDLVSMYRKINYDKVDERRINDAADAVKNRAAQLKDFPNGNDISVVGTKSDDA